MKEDHFHTAHYSCTHPDCLSRKFVVFNTHIDLKAHLVEEHGADMSSKDRKDARRIQADFTFERARRDRNNERGPDSPPSRPQQIQALGLAIGPGQLPPSGSRRREGFGTALTETDVGIQPSSGNNQNIRPLSPDTGPAEAE